MNSVVLYVSILAICALGFGLYSTYDRLTEVADKSARLEAQLAELNRSIDALDKSPGTIEESVRKEISSTAKERLSIWSASLASELSSDRAFAERIGSLLAEDHQEQLRAESPNPAEVAKYIVLDDSFALLVAREIDLLKAQ